MRRLFPLLLLAACGLDETYTGMGEGALPGDPLNPDPVACEGLDCPACTCNCGGDGPAEDAEEDTGQLEVDDLTGTAWRIDALTFSAPLTGLFGDELNGVIKDEIEAGNINVILHVTGDDRSTGRLDLDVGAAATDAGGYAFSEAPSPLVCELEGQLFTTGEPGALTVPTELMTPPALPISELLLAGRIAADGTGIAEGVLDGVLTGEDAAEIKIAGVPLGTMLPGLEVPPDVDLDGDGTPESWRFVGDFTATAVTLHD
ncbi:MAG: hypothetical protein FJ098_04715 [Deltaproteobacteria bacterium]|nr:hypothetical protein [Deltaproteobacteria bacterium]